MNLNIPNFFRISSNVEKESMKSVRRNLRLNHFDHMNLQPQFDVTDAKYLFDKIYSLDEKDLEDKLAYMLLPFSEYLFDCSAHKKTKVSLFEQYAKSKPPFNPDGVI